MTAHGEGGPYGGSPWEDDRVRRGMRRQLEEREQLLRRGARSRGWKLGLGTAAAMRDGGLDGALVGYFTDRTLAPPTRPLPVDRLGNPLLEPEVAIRVSGDPGPNPSAAEARRAIAGVRPALELADIDLALVSDPSAVLALNLFHSQMVFGDGERAGAEVDDVAVRPSGSDVPARSPVDPVETVAYLARYLAAFGLRLAADDVIMSGAAADPVAVAPGQRIGFDFGGLGAIEVEIASLRVSDDVQSSA